MFHGLVKSDENDAVALSMISPTWFKEPTLDRLLLEMDIMRYRRLSRIISTLKKWRADGGLGGDVAVQLIRQLDAEKGSVGRRIVKMVRSDPFYGELYRRGMERLGLGDGAVVTAVLSVKLPLYLNMDKLLRFISDLRPDAKETWRYRHDLRDWLARSAITICATKKRTRN